jgi:hypothetical protein
VVHPDSAEYKARHTGDVYVLAPFVRDREAIPFQHNVGTRLLIKLDRTERITDPEVREFLDEIERGVTEVRDWIRAAWAGPPPERRTDTWERVFTALRNRGAYGATCAELQYIVGLGHGAVSGALSLWDQAECAARLKTAPQEGP